MKIPLDLEKQIVKIYQEQNLSCRAIDKMFNLTHKTSSCILRKYNIKIIGNRGGKQGRKYSVNDGYFEKIKTEEQAYWLGWMFSDGYNDEINDIIQLGIQENDIVILEKFKISIKSNNPIEIRLDSKKGPNHQNICRIRISSKTMSESLAKLGCVQAKSLILKFPTEEQVPPHLIRHFIRGLWDGDGCIYHPKENSKYPNMFSANLVGSIDICSKVHNYLNDNFDIWTSFSNIKNKNENTKLITISGRKQVVRFGDWLYKDATIFLQRKYDKYVHIKNSIK